MGVERTWFWRVGPVVYAGAFLLLGALLAPVLHWLVQPIDENPFRRYTDRALMIAALLCLLPYLIRHWGQLGWRGGLTWWKALLLGLAVAVGSVVVINGLLMGLGYRVLEVGDLTSVILKAVVAAVLVGTLEEILFRGVMLNALCARLGREIGFWLTALLYAWVHFLKAPESFQPDPVTWTSGFTSVGLAMGHLFSADVWLEPRIWTLLLVGIVLGLAYWRTGALWLPIGLHAGWILGIQISSKATELTPAGREFSLGSDVLTGGLTMVVLVLLALGLWRWPSPSSKSPSSTGSTA